MWKNNRKRGGINYCFSHVCMLLKNWIFENRSNVEKMKKFSVMM